MNSIQFNPYIHSIQSSNSFNSIHIYEFSSIQSLNSFLSIHVFEFNSTLTRSSNPIQYSYPFYPILAHFPFNPMPKFIQSSWGERGQSLVFNKAHFRASAILSICCGKAGMLDQDGESRCTEKVGLIPFPCRHVKFSRPLICTYKNAEKAGEDACFA